MNPDPIIAAATLIGTPRPDRNRSSSVFGGEALHRDDDVSRVAPAEAPAVPVLAQVHPLPRAEGELAVRDGDVDRRPDQSALNN